MADFGARVSDALAHLHDQVYLQTHPLLHSLPTTDEMRPRSSSVGRGAALSRELISAVDSLRPAAGSADPIAARRHQVLALRYVDGLDVPAVASQLAVSRRQFYYEHRAALEAVTSLLRERWGLGASAHPEAPVLPAIRIASVVHADAAPLPRPLTSFVGREPSIAAVVAHLAEAQLVTLTGPPGTGKTRLAIAVAQAVVDEAQSAPRFPDGVHFVALASVADPALVVPTIAHALGAPEVEQLAPAPTLVRHLHGRRLLCVLDNFEQVGAAAPAIADLLGACPGLRLLVTSRSPLRIAGEQEFPVAPLALPDPSYLPSAEQLVRYEAVRLLVERARAQRPGFVLAEAQRAAAVEICRRLDGLPLAIELAAARTRVLSLDQIALRLDDVFEVLGAPHRDAPSHQRSLRAAMDWSFALLTPAEATLFSRLSVFAGDFDLEAVQAVCAVRDVLDTVDALVQHSLVAATETAGAATYRMLETIRQYAAEKLRAVGETAEVRQRHLDWMTELAQAGADVICDPGHLAQLAVLQAELRAALTWAVESGQADAGFRLLRATFGFWYVRGHYSECRAWFDSLSRLPGGCARSATRAGALALAGQIAYCQCDFAAGERHLEEALSICRELGDDAAAALAMNVLGNLVYGRGELDRAAALYEEAQEVNRRLGLRFWELLGAFGIARTELLRGDGARARCLAEKALAETRAHDYPWIAARLLRLLGRLDALQADHDAARRRYEEALTIQRAMDDHQGEAQTLISLAEALAAVERHYDAADAYREALRPAFEAGQTREMVLCLEGLALHATDAPERGVWLAAAADRIRGAAGGTPWPTERDRLEMWRAAVRRQLGGDAYARAEAHGRALSLGEVVDLAVAADRGLADSAA